MHTFALFSLLKKVFSITEWINSIIVMHMIIGIIRCTSMHFNTHAIFIYHGIQLISLLSFFFPGPHFIINFSNENLCCFAPSISFFCAQLWWIVGFYLCFNSLSGQFAASTDITTKILWSYPLVHDSCEPVCWFR